MSTALLYGLNRHHDVSNVSGEGDEKATICEFSSGLTVMHWNTETPSIAIYTDFRHIEELHGHKGASELVLHDSSRAERLVTAYERAMRHVLSARYADRPVTCAEHPDHPGCLRLTFKTERVWRFWVALLDGSTYASTHEQVAGETEHRWVSPDGLLWLMYHSPLSSKYERDPIHDPRD